MNKLSEAAKSALINTTGRQGAEVKADVLVISELAQADLIGPENGLTRKGTIARERAVRQAEDLAFGA